MNSKYQIFISSTYEDLKDEREEVLKTILRLGHIPIGMEMFNAANETQWQMIKRRIEESDYYIVIVARRYGSIESSSGLSYTEKEYDYATSIGVPTLGFVLSHSAAWPGDREDSGPDKQEKQVALAKFAERVGGKVRASWTNKYDLAAAISPALIETISAFPGVGWIRANQAVSPEMANEITRLSRENADLRKQLESAPAAPPVFAPDFSLEMWISWDTWTDPGYHRAGESDQMQGYRLHLDLKNVGNAASEMVDAKIYIPRDVVVDLRDHLLEERAGVHYEVWTIGNWSRSSNGRDRSPMLTGVSRHSERHLSTDAVENPGPYILLYAIHSDLGFSKSEEVALADIEVRSRRPEGEAENPTE